MNRAKSFLESPVANWAMTVISAFMIYQYIGLSADEDRAIPGGFVLAAWIVMFVIWLATAIYRTWFRRPGNST